MYSAFKEMPMLLKFLTAHALVCLVFFFAAVIPGIPITFNGEVMESQELWGKGVGLPTAAVGLVFPFCGILMLRKWAYARQAYLLVFFSVMVVPYLIWKELPSLIIGLVISVAIAAYLYKEKKACAYFSP